MGDIEVEMKFPLNEDIEANLHEIGAVFKSCNEIVDSYYDTTSYQLTLNDVWLRRRNGRYQLKCRVPQNSKDIKTSAYRYTHCYKHMDFLVKAFAKYMCL